MKNIDRVIEFHETYACFINDMRSMDNFDKSLVTQRYNLINEEVGELIAAIIDGDRLEMLDALTDIEYVVDGTYLTFGMTRYNLKDFDYAEGKQAVVKQISSMGNHMSLPFLMMGAVVMMVEEYMNNDIDGVEESLYGMSVILDVMFEEYEFSDVREAAGVEVHRSNMSKLSEEGRPIHRESDGKVMKGPNYFKPNLRQFIVDDKRRNPRTG